MTRFNQGKRGVFLIALFFSVAACSNGGGSSSSGGELSTGTAGGGYEDLSGLSLNEVTSINLSNQQSSLSISSSSSSTSTYVVAIIPTSDSTNATIQLLSQSSVSTPKGGGLLGLTLQDPTRPPESEESLFHQYLMEMGEYMTQSDEFRPAAPPSFAGLAKQLSVGEGRSFKVLSSMSSINQYTTVQSTLRIITDDLLIYVDNNASSQVSSEDVEILAADFNNVALPLERELFGHESDVNSDGRMIILMTPILNQMASSSGLVTGFFYPGDLYSAGASNPASNQMEIFYTMVPDPEGDFGPSVSTDFTINNILPGVLAHEYQHMTSFQQHVFLNQGSAENSWLNEALAHFAEDITGFGKENPSRVRLGLANPPTSPLVPPSSPGLAERGMAYLFVRYLYEQSADGDQFISNLFSSASTGTENIEQAFAGTDPNFDDFSDFAKRWALAVALSETGVTSDPVYNYQARTVHANTGNYVGICLRCNTQDGRGTVLSGPVMANPSSYPLTAAVEPWAVQFFIIEHPTDAVSVNIANGASAIGVIAKLK